MSGMKLTMMQNPYQSKTCELKSSMSEVTCYVCGKGLDDGSSITAKTLPNGIVLFCDLHYSLQ